MWQLLCDSFIAVIGPGASSRSERLIADSHGVNHDSIFAPSLISPFFLKMPGKHASPRSPASVCSKEAVRNLIQSDIERGRMLGTLSCVRWLLSVVWLCTQRPTVKAPYAQQQADCFHLPAGGGVHSEGRRVRKGCDRVMWPGHVTRTLIWASLPFLFIQTTATSRFCLDSLCVKPTSLQEHYQLCGLPQPSPWQPEHIEKKCTGSPSDCFGFLCDSWW